MKHFKSALPLHRFVSTHEHVANLFDIRRHYIPSARHRELSYHRSR